MRGKLTFKNNSRSLLCANEFRMNSGAKTLAFCLKPGLFGEPLPYRADGRKQRRGLGNEVGFKALSILFVLGSNSSGRDADDRLPSNARQQALAILDQETGEFEERVLDTLERRYTTSQYPPQLGLEADRLNKLVPGIDGAARDRVPGPGA
jgi:hypothetical protein